MALPDYVERRIVIEWGRQYVYLYLTNGEGKLIAGREESFKQPYIMERQEVHAEATELWDLAYDHLNDIVNVNLQEGADDSDDAT